MGIFTRKKKVEEKKTETSSEVKTSEKKSVEKKTVAKTEPKKTVEKKEKVFIASKAKQIIVRPLITEKATMLGKDNKYLFEVHPGTNKVEIKKEMKRLYEVAPVDVRIINKRGRKVRYGRRTGTTKHWKKAIVTLKDGDHIESKVGA